MGLSTQGGQKMAKLVLQTDFGLVDGAVAAMYGVAYGVDGELSIHDLTHEIPPYDIFAASYRLYQTTKYWPEGTVFVSVVDPGVGSDRRSIIAETVDHHFIITPDNGTLTH
jgi:S-adenosylmethionine hydrolase